jgi:hypothetical protein
MCVKKILLADMVCRVFYLLKLQTARASEFFNVFS